MVMKRNAMRSNLRQSIFKSLGRYIAIAAIIALGAGIFVGLLMTKADMVATGQEFMDEQNMFDIRLVSTYGWGREQVDQARRLQGIESAEGVYYKDLIVRYGDKTEDEVYRFYTLPEQINRVALEGGRMPENINECLVDGHHADDSILGTQILLSNANDEDDLEDLKHYRYTVVGYMATPLYMDANRGTTSVGSGSLEGYVYVPQNSVNADHFAEIHLTIPGNHKVYSETYNDLLEEIMDAIEPMAEEMGQNRFDSVKAEAEEEYQDGYLEYLDGVEEYEEGKLEAEQELADAYQELIDGEQEIEDTYRDLQNAEHKLYKAKKQIEEGKVQLRAGKAALTEAKAAAEAQKPTLDAGKAALEAATGKSLSELTGIVSSAPGKIGEIEQQIGVLQEVLAAEPDEGKKGELAAQIAALQAEKEKLNWLMGYSGEIQSIAAGYAALDQIYAQEKELLSNERKLEEGMEEVKRNITKVYNGYQELEEAKLEIADGWEEYYEGKAEAEAELADAEAELADAKLDLEEAREDIDAMEKPDVIILDRNSNVGYNNLDSSSDIVQGVSRVFPVFFLLIASLVCITTMTRMVEEERTQIGTLKALGYSNTAIISKYLLYAGSSAIIGCGLGIFAGSSAFPMIIWDAYKTMLHIKPDVVLTVNWLLCFAVIAVYTAVILTVTWYCCHKTLEEVPAELIRPRAPDAGKALFVEKLPFWGRISFLNKVTIRNIFRYRQRLAMMLVGIGGCTALLVTGFGLRDSILNVVDYQFENVTQYDLQIYFRDDLNEKTKADVLKKLEPGAEQMFHHQSSVELQYDNRVKEIDMISAGAELKSFIHFRVGSQDVAMPGLNEVVLSVGVAEAMGIEIGETVLLRDPDMEILELTVSGIYDNHIDNFAIVLPETIAQQWGSEPQQQMAYVRLPDGVDVHAAGAHIAELNSVMNVSVSMDTADMVQNMMQALDLVIVVIVFCAGLLAVTVLYNLTNININERIREIATIKVLGFNASETAAYVFKENMALTVAGSVLGLGLGYLLLIFVISQVKIDMVWFKTVVEPMSYVYSMLMTLLSAIVVNFIFYFKLQKINMAEALKSVE